MFTYCPTIVGKALRLSHVNPLCRILPMGRGGRLSSKSTGCVVTKWRDMGSFGASREWDGVHLYGYVFTGIITSMGRIFGFWPLSCELHYLKTKELT